MKGMKLLKESYEANKIVLDRRRYRAVRRKGEWGMYARKGIVLEEAPWSGISGIKSRYWSCV
jgi:hypothetical protein